MGKMRRADGGRWSRWADEADGLEGGRWSRWGEWGQKEQMGWMEAGSNLLRKYRWTLIASHPKHITSSPPLHSTLGLLSFTPSRSPHLLHTISCTPSPSPHLIHSIGPQSPYLREK
ncbi:hypothetical protein [Paenibacillus odorifer]|uniref:hypothetical protein n=1 Tax=Paenibacillus odorifer TaxID=189426 RepID=UPI00117D5C3E|nr:hypothetical protein [Paenibacillus odorifer]